MKALILGTIAFALVNLPAGAQQGLPSSMPSVKGTPQVAFSLRSVDIKLGTGELLTPRKCVYANYTGWLTNGSKFDSSLDTMPNGKRRTPIAFAQGAKRVITGWDVGFEGMRVGGSRRLFIPYQLGYGEAGRPPVIPAKSELVFDVELMALADTLPRTVPVPKGQTPPPPKCPTWAEVSLAK
jgi:peptidylprolyl isomerase